MGTIRTPTSAPHRWAGSPPRAWGQYQGIPAGGSITRFTPTGVGTIHGTPRIPTRRPVHPHGRGDNSYSRSASPNSCGSPPRAWGQSPRRATPRPQSRFTPTGVGTIAPTRPISNTSSVHPHGRGDNRGGGGDRVNLPGSPPRAWGQWFFWFRFLRAARFTPTGVGTMRRRG